MSAGGAECLGEREGVLFWFCEKEEWKNEWEIREKSYI